MFIICLGILISKGGGQKDQNDPSKFFKLYFAIPLRVKIQTSPFYRTGCIRMVAISRSRGGRAAMYSLKKKKSDVMYPTTHLPPTPGQSSQIVKKHQKIRLCF